MENLQKKNCSATCQLLLEANMRHMTIWIDILQYVCACANGHCVLQPVNLAQHAQNAIRFVELTMHRILINYYLSSGGDAPMHAHKHGYFNCYRFWTSSHAMQVEVYAERNATHKNRNTLEVKNPQVKSTYFSNVLINDDGQNAHFQLAK